MSDPKYTLVEYVAANRFAASNAARDSFAPEFPVGLRVQADCGADGLRLGSVTGAAHDAGTGRTLVDVALDAGAALTANLTAVLHNNNTPESLAGHGHTGPTDGGLLAAVLAATPGHYSRDVRFAAKPVAVAADRCVLLSPNRMGVNVGGLGLYLAARQALDLSQAATWDSVATDYTVAANRAGKDFYVYAVLVGGAALGLRVSANAANPTGYEAATARQIGGFHCLCVAVGTISDHPLSGYAAGDILPASVWDLKHRPASAPEGMVYVAGIGKWVDIYLASISGGQLATVYNGLRVGGEPGPLGRRLE